MKNLTVTSLLVCALAVAACSRPGHSVRTGPQVENPVTGIADGYALTGTAFSSDSEVKTPPSEYSFQIVQSFISLCHQNLDAPEAIARTATSQGFNILPGLGALGETIGLRKATDESVQINVATKHAFECAVTTSDVSNPAALRDEFFSAVGLPTGRSQVEATINGNNYFYRFDSNGGEALVVYRK